MHEQGIEINASQTDQCKSSSCPLMVRAKTGNGCELTNCESRIESDTNQLGIHYA